MDRRTFVRVVGGVGLTSTIPFRYAVASSGLAAPSGVLLEASAFADAGGWKLDTQHYQQMGGVYLLAHGMGEPVADATSRVRLPEPGAWRVWVRTRDWRPGEWESPGRFRVSVNGKPLDPVFGQGEEKWHWADGGVVSVEEAGEVDVALHDLTGFDGRCDAIYFSREADPALPNDDLARLTDWKDQATGRDGGDVIEDEFDLVIVGGGIAGCGAALAARSQGLKVALVQDRPVFGGNASDEIRVHTIGIPGKGDDLLATIDTPHYPNGSAEAIQAQAKREATMAASGVDPVRAPHCDWA